MTMYNKRQGYIDCLRGVAVVLVVAVHVGQHVPAGTTFARLAQYGQYGVQLFFVLSAYSLCLAFGKAEEARMYSGFIARRFLRIAPMYYVALAIFFLCTYCLERWKPSAVFYTPTDYYTLFRVGANLLLLHGLVESANNTIVPGGWSIGCEMLFYAIFPIMYRAVERSRAVLVFIPALSLGLQMLIMQFVPPSVVATHRGFLFYSLLSQLPCFIMGMAVYTMGGNRIFSRLTVGVTPLAVYFLYRAHHDSWGWLISPACAAVSAAGLLILFRKLNGEWGGLSQLGRLSFSIYCLHYLFVGGITDRLVAWLNTKSWPPEMVSVGAFGVVCLLSILTARFTYTWVEIPFINLGRVVSIRIGEYEKRRGNALAA